MTQQTVGHVYAEALFLLAQEELDVPTLELPERISVLQKIIGEEQGITENFLCLLVEKRRINRISEIRNAFNKLYYEAFKIAEVFVTSAVPLEETQRTALKEKLQQKLKKNILLRESVDKSLMGGMIVQYGDTRMDNSLKGRLQAFAQQ